MTKRQTCRSRGVLSSDASVTPVKGEQGSVLYTTELGGRGEQ